jgi:hypothetical protein
VTDEQIKLLATACNNLGVGSVLAGFIVPLVNGQSGSLSWYVFGVVWIGVAQLVIGELE